MPAGTVVAMAASYPLGSYSAGSLLGYPIGNAPADQLASSKVLVRQALAGEDASLVPGKNFQVAPKGTTGTCAAGDANVRLRAKRRQFNKGLARIRFNFVRCTG